MCGRAMCDVLRARLSRAHVRRARATCGMPAVTDVAQAFRPAKQAVTDVVQAFRPAKQAVTDVAQAFRPANSEAESSELQDPKWA